MTYPKKKRNNNIGIRSNDALKQRTQQRSIKRNLARRLHRTNKRKPPDAPAQELPPRMPRLKLGKHYRIATINIRGIKKAGKRTELEQYIDFKRIDILVIQETHVGDEIREQFKKSSYSWFFPGGAQGATCYHGVAIVVKNELRNYIKDIAAIDERLMTFTQSGQIDVTIVAAYAPTAIATAEDKDKF